MSAQIREQIDFYRQEPRQLATLGLTDMAPDELASAALGSLTGVVESYCPPSRAPLNLPQDGVVSLDLYFSCVSS